MESEKGKITSKERGIMREKMLGFIFPNTPQTAEERKAFNRAVNAQIEYEHSLQDTELPAGATSVRIGHFQVQMSDSWAERTGELNRRTICSAAYSVLLRAGLLCKYV